VTVAYGYIPPAENLVNVGWDAWKPSAGYVWRNDGQVRQGVKWQPGLAHPSLPHVLSIREEQLWAPELGYKWVTSTPEDGVRWEPGQRHSDYPNAAAAETEGYWRPDAGYAFSKPGQLSAAIWQPGLEHRDFKNVLAAGKEGTWSPRPGFRFETPSTLSQAVWVPGSSHPDVPNILADAKVGEWKPVAGFAWVSDTPNDLRVVALQSDAVTNTETNAGTFESRASRFFVGLIKAKIGSELREPSKDDGFVTRYIGRPMAEELRNDGFRDMARALSGR